MIKLRAGVLLLGVSILLIWPAASDRGLHAQMTAADYARAERFLSWNAQRLVSGTSVDPHWMAGDAFWYRNRTVDGFEFLVVDPEARTQQAAFDHVRLAAALSVAADTSYEPNKLPFTEFEFVDDQRTIRFNTKPKERWTCDLTTYDCTGPDSTTADPITEAKSPDGRWVAFEEDENLFIREAAGGDSIQLSDDGEEHYGYAVNPEGCCYVVTGRRNDTKQRPVLTWSPDSKKIATLRLDERDVESLHLLETAAGRAKLHSYKYALPGDSIIPMFEIFIFDVESRNRVRVNVDPQPMDFGAMAEDSIWTSVRWSADGEELYFTQAGRDRNAVTLMVADVTTGEARRIIEETGPTFVELNLDLGEVPNWRATSGGTDVIWFSEQDGWGHLYRYDAATGALKNQITSGPWVVATLLLVDESAGWVYFTAVGGEPDRDIYYRHLYRVELDGSDLQLLTPEDADHDVRVSPSGNYFIDTYSTRRQAPVTVLRGKDGRVLQTLQEANIDRLLEAGWRYPEHFVVKARDGVTDIHGLLYLPSDFDEQKSYPVIDYIYPGPQVGPIGWRGFRADPSGQTQALAELGFIVVTLDATGTPFRSKAFHDRWYGDMGDNGIPEHIAAIKQLAAQYPIDLDRVGIFGHSGGGFSSTDAILRYPEFFKVAVSSAGNHDNRAYFYAWAERYQGQLVRDEDGTDNYDSQANQNLAANLEGKLLLMYGSLDDNVHPNATLLLVDELIDHNKDFDLIVLPNRNHRFFYEPYVIRRTWDYFVRNLLYVEPPREYEIKPPPSN